MITPATRLLRRFALALCIYREGRGEPMQGKLWIGQTVKNRVDDTRWPDTYIGVITQPFQFSAFNRTDPNVTVFPHEEEPAWEACVLAADQVIDAPTPFTTANHYHVHGLEPAWADSRKIVGVAGRHVFYAL
jgi:spore germination cell wall hydrolase CwlJ-like protein